MTAPCQVSKAVFIWDSLTFFTTRGPSKTWNVLFIFSSSCFRLQGNGFSFLLLQTEQTKTPELYFGVQREREMGILLLFKKQTFSWICVHKVITFNFRSLPHYIHILLSASCYILKGTLEMTSYIIWKSQSSQSFVFHILPMGQLYSIHLI